MFDATHPFSFFDYFRVPYRLTADALRDASGDERPRIPPRCGAVRASEGGRTICWPLLDQVDQPPDGFAELGAFRLNGIHVVGHGVPDEAARSLLDDYDTWDVVAPMIDSDGHRVASVRRDGDGNVFLPFDPGECMEYLWSERYVQLHGSALASKVKSSLLRAYYLVRPLLPRRIQIAARRVFAKIQGRRTFPRWPQETSLHDLYDWLFDLVADVAGAPVPWIDVWPDGYRWAFVLTHDVEARGGYDDLNLLRDPERELGFRSSWNFVPLRLPEEARYEVGATVLEMLERDGCEVGVHGLHHDGRDLESLSLLQQRLPTIRTYADRWDAVGFRAPATQRDWRWMPLLGFDYDSSYSDTDPYEPIAGGCCSLLPFFNERMVELPITLPQDHTAFVILQHADGALWLDKAAHIRDRGGMALVLTHPDYARDSPLVDAYRSLLAFVDEDPSAWRALPRDVSDWWRRRADSSLEATETGWAIRGPAATDGTVRFTPAPDARTVEAGDGVDAGSTVPVRSS
ncbi:MAG: hypothetical protein ACXWZC_13885 [Actinomycetota bacterium]